MGERQTLTGGRTQALISGVTRWPGTAAVDRRPGQGATPLQWAARATLPLALALWLVSLRGVDLNGMRDFGLLQVLPVLFWVAIGVLALGFSLALADRRTGTGWFLAYVLGLIAMIHATPTLLYPTLRYSWAWKHVAVVDAVIRHNGEVPSAEKLSLYNQWPGFFELNAFFLRATGLESALGYAAWAPPVVNVLLIGPLLLLYRSVTRRKRLIWGAVWLYYSCSWVGQDYFAPQAFAFLLFVTLTALVMGQLPTSALRRSGAGGRRAWPVGRFVIVLVLEVVIVSSHPLTPLMMLTALAALSIPRRNRRVVLPALAGAVLLTVLWDATVARPYVSSHLHDFISALVRADANVVSGLAALGTAAPGQVIVSWVDRCLSAVVFLLAALAFLIRPWVRRTGLPLLVVAPLPLVAANAYGGEMIFRAYLFALPAAAFLIATVLFQRSERPPPSDRGERQSPVDAGERPPPSEPGEEPLALRRGERPVLRALAVYPVLMALLGGLFFGYYGKESATYFTKGEVAAVRYVMATAPPDSLIVTLTSAAPGLYTRYDEHSRAEVDEWGLDDRRRLLRNPVAGLTPFVQRSTAARPAFVILTRAQAADTYFRGVLPADTVQRTDAALARTPAFVPVYRNPDAVVYRYQGSAGGSE